MFRFARSRHKVITFEIIGEHNVSGGRLGRIAITASERRVIL